MWGWLLLSFTVTIISGGVGGALEQVALLGTISPPYMTWVTPVPTQGAIVETIIYSAKVCGPCMTIREASYQPVVLSKFVPRRENAESFINVCSAFYYLAYLYWAFQGDLWENLLDIQGKIIFTLVRLYAKTLVNYYFCDKLKYFPFS